MSARDPEPGTVELSGLDGASPLGFLAALGTLVTLHTAGERHARLRWKWSRVWTPGIDGASATETGRFSEIVACGLEGHDVPPEAEARRAAAEQCVGAAKKAVSDKRGEIRKRGLKGAARRAAIAAEVTPLQDAYQRARGAWHQALAAAVPRAELALGNRIDCTPEEYRQLTEALLAGAGPADRDTLDLLAAFGTDARVNTRTRSIEPTPFQFITGSGHQFFLKTARDLLQKVTVARVRSTLFEPWTYSDEGLSMRWDPVEDRRYALMDRDPTRPGNEPRTVWMANLLGYRGLALFPYAPRRGRIRVVGWMDLDDGSVFTWPLWQHPASVDTIRSLLALPELTMCQPDRVALRARGVVGVFRARRIRVPPTGANYKLNFTPPRAV